MSQRIEDHLDFLDFIFSVTRKISNSSVASPRFCGAQSFDFVRTTVFCLRHHLSKHKMTKICYNFGAMASLAPWLHLWFPTKCSREQTEYERLGSGSASWTSVSVTQCEERGYLVRIGLCYHYRAIRVWGCWWTCGDCEQKTMHWTNEKKIHPGTDAEASRHVYYDLPAGWSNTALL